MPLFAFDVTRILIVLNIERDATAEMSSVISLRVAYLQCPVTVFPIHRLDDHDSFKVFRHKIIHR